MCELIEKNEVTEETEFEKDEECCSNHHGHSHNNTHEYFHHHNHVHHHHEEGCKCDDCVSGVSIVEHEGALAGSFEKENVARKYIEMDSIICESMIKIKKLVDDVNGIIGHIKVAIKEGESIGMYSLTYEDVDKKGDFEIMDTVESVSFAAILYGVEKETFRALLVEIKEAI